MTFEYKRETMKEAPAARLTNVHSSLRQALLVTGNRALAEQVGQQLAQFDCKTSVAGSTAGALELMTSLGARVGLLVLDYQLPGLDPEPLLEPLRETSGRHDTTILVCNATREELIALKASARGDAHAMAWSGNNNELAFLAREALDLSTAAAELREQLRSHWRSAKFMEACKFRIRTPQEAIDLAPAIAQVFPEPERVKAGIVELLNNAIEHGNLEIGFERKAELVESGRFFRELKQRLAQPEYADRSVEVVFSRRDDRCCLVITDQGKGFDWEPFLDIQPARAASATGRGIARARLISFDKLIYCKSGNQVAAYVNATPNFDW